ncbi:type IV pilin protein [Elusimicrobium simillimum]
MRSPLGICKQLPLRTARQRCAGFTLMELSIVVIIIALMAGFALPQYEKSVERGRVTEAIDILSHIRSEQETRALLGNSTGKGYAKNFDQLGPVVSGITSPNADSISTDNFTYKLVTNTDTTKSYASASRNGTKYSYTIRLINYRDSNLCCVGDDCSFMVGSHLKSTCD